MINKVAKVFVCLIFIGVFLFLISSNVEQIEDEERKIPTAEELEQFNNIPSKSSINSYEVKDIPDKELAAIYYNHYKNLVVNNPTEAYKIISNKQDVSQELFNSFRTNLVNNYYSSSVKTYKIATGNDSSTYRIVNTEDQIFTFYVKAVFKYQVEISL